MTTTHHIGRTESYVPGTVAARSVFDELLTARLSPVIAYTRDGFSIDLPDGLSDAELENELADAEGRIRMEVGDLLDDGGLAQELEARNPS